MASAVVALAGAWHAAHALDALAVKPPVEVTDGRISIGARTLWLPPGPGRWYFVDHGEIPISGGTDGTEASVDDRVMLARVDHGVLVFGIDLWLLRKDIARSGWDFLPCDRTANIYFNEHPRPPSLRDCVTVRGQVTTVFQQHLAAIAPGALTWLAERKIELPPAIAKIRYGRFHTNTYGVIDLFVPAKAFDSELSTIAWAESVRTALQPLFEHRENEAHVPTLPKPSAARARSAPASAAK